MTITRRGLITGSLGTLAVGALSACGGVGDSGNDASKGGAGKGDTGALSTQGFGKPDDVGQARIDAFKSAYPNVQVNLNEGDFDPQQFLSAVASGNPPDLVYLDRGLVGSYASRGAIQPLDDLLGGAGIKTGDYREAAIKEVTLDGKVYGVPEFYNTRNILVNGKAIEEAGLTLADVSTTDWNRLHTVTRQLYRAAGGRTTRIGFDPKLPEFLPLWAKANGADLVNPDGSPNLEDPKIIEALTYALSLIDEQGGWSKFKAFRDTWDLFGAGNQFVKNQAAAFPWEGWYVNVLVQSSPKIDLRSTPFTDRQGKPITFQNGSAWCLPKDAKNPAAAVNWMKVMTSTDTWLKAGAARQATVEQNKSIFTGLWTANTAADEQVKAKYVKPGPTGFDKAVENYYAASDYAFGVNASKAGSEIKVAWQEAVNRALSGQQKPDAALRQAQSEASKAFSAAK
ncbi:ABC transporter substrate-binding protein [Plantactinospora endophytica]|uniref:Sugar ABC transporter substrate-binding protein n=1 Tax=Plantactinospora endophytica TaxID=673535 RepID=A0ABQ4E7L6_9ACTN|nr:sugar ABC transporter substrate-binding protein [Plantactinospora endophytica]GIG90714.1 sugar ABC transporter substrate-binding protein [Plantactinospora endophytica]